MFPRRKHKKTTSELQADVIRAAKNLEIVEASVERNLRISNKILRRIAIPTIIAETAAVPAMGAVSWSEFSHGNELTGIGAIAISAVFAYEARSVYMARKNGDYEQNLDPMYIPDNWTD